MVKYSLENVLDFDFSLIAISSSEPDYKLCIHLNQSLGISLVRQKPLDLEDKTLTEPLIFSYFFFESESTYQQYILLSNLSANSVGSKEKSAPSLFDTGAAEDIKGYLAPELAKYDYLMMLKGEDHDLLAREVQPKIKKITFVQAIRLIDLETLASKKNLLI